MYPYFFARQTVGFAPPSFDHLHSITYMTETYGKIASMPPECLQEMAPQPAIRSPVSWTPQEGHLTKICENVIFCRRCRFTHARQDSFALRIERHFDYRMCIECVQGRRNYPNKPNISIWRKRDSSRVGCPCKITVRSRSGTYRSE